MHFHRTLTVVCCLAMAMVQNVTSNAQNPEQKSREEDKGVSLSSRLTEAGVEFPNGLSVALEPPSFDRSLDAAAQQAVLDKIATGIGWERFSRNSYVAPIEIDLQYVKNDDGERVGHLVYVAFVAFVEVDQLRDREKMKSISEESADDAKTNQYRAEDVSPEEIAEWGIDTPTEQTSFLKIQVPLLDRVLVRGWLQVQQANDDKSIMISWLLDPRFATTNLQPRGNHWFPFGHADTGEPDVEGRKDGDDHAYQGFGGYMHITQLSEPAGASLIEARMVIHEPKEWFRGSNLLRSKLPLMIQESVRKFRRDWAERKQ